MSWVATATAVDIDRPRRLTDNEIQYIASQMPLAPAADADSAELTRAGVVEWLTKELREVELCPSAIPQLVQQIVEYHHRSLIAAGTPIGITAAEAVGASTTQITLNTFHTSGSSKSASFGIEAMRDLIFARKTPHNESCTIYFDNKSLTYEQVLESRSYIVGSTVFDFVKKERNVPSYDIDSPEVLSQHWWHRIRPQPRGTTQVLRLFLDTVEMYKHRVTMRMLAEALGREASGVEVFYSPIADGIIDVYPDPDSVIESMRKKIKVPREMAEVTYLETIVMPELKNIRVKGVAGIKKLYPVVSPVWRTVLLEKPYPASEGIPPNSWILYYNENIMRLTGLVPGNLAALCQLAGMTIFGGNEVALVVTMPPDVTSTKPSDYVMARVAQDKRNRGQEIQRLTRELNAQAQSLPEAERVAMLRRPVVVPRTDLMVAAEFVIAETDGANLQELLALPGIDKNRTTCNNMYTIAKTLGIEATRTMLVRALNNTIANTGSYVHPSNIMFIAEFITSRGEPYGATYTGVSRQAPGHLSLATLERGGKVFTTAGLHGRKEDIRNVSASVALGARMAIGDGFFDIAQDVVQPDGSVRTILNDELFTALAPSEAPSATTEFDLAADLAALQNIPLTEQFDYNKADDVTNYLTLFGEGTDIRPEAPQPTTPHQIVRRVASELTNVNDDIVTGIPQPNVRFEKILEESLAPAPRPLVTEPVRTTGLVDLGDILRGVEPAMRGGVPVDIIELVERYFPGENPIMVAAATVTPLPQVPISNLPTLEGIDLEAERMALREEQLRDLVPIDTSALQSALRR